MLIFHSYFDNDFQINFIQFWNTYIDNFFNLLKLPFIYTHYIKKTKRILLYMYTSLIDIFILLFLTLLLSLNYNRVFDSYKSSNTYLNKHIQYWSFLNTCKNSFNLFSYFSCIQFFKSFKMVLKRGKLRR